MRIVTIVSALFLIADPVFAQSYDAPEDEEIIELSPFRVTSDEYGYAAATTLTGNRLATQLIDPLSANVQPTVPVSIYRKPDAVAVQFVLSHAGDRQEARNKELYASVEALQAVIAKTPGMRLEQREVRFTGGNRKLFSISRGTSPVSFASVIIFADLTAGIRIVDRVKEIRELLESTKLVGQTKALDGSVGLYLRNPQQYRQELLQRIFEDFAVLKQGLGAEFEIRPSGLNQRMRTRVSSETEIELWIDYSFAINSVRELERPMIRAP